MSKSLDLAHEMKQVVFEKLYSCSKYENVDDEVVNDICESVCRVVIEKQPKKTTFWKKVINHLKHV